MRTTCRSAPEFRDGPGGGDVCGGPRIEIADGRGLVALFAAEKKRDSRLVSIPLPVCGEKAPTVRQGQYKFSANTCD